MKEKELLEVICDLWCAFVTKPGPGIRRYFEIIQQCGSSITGISVSDPLRCKGRCDITNMVVRKNNIHVITLSGVDGVLKTFSCAKFWVPYFLFWVDLITLRNSSKEDRAKMLVDVYKFFKKAPELHAIEYPE